MPVKTKKKTVRPKRKEVKKESLEVITPERLDKELTIKQQLFIKEYLKEFNAKKSAEMAGYSKKTAYSIAGLLLNNIEVQKAIKKEIVKVFEGKDVELDKIVTEISKIAFLDIKEFLSYDNNGVYFKDSDLVDGTMIKKVKSTTLTTKEGDVRTTMEFELHDKLKALEMLGKWKSMFNDIQPQGIINANEVKTVIIQVNRNG